MLKFKRSIRLFLAALFTAGGFAAAAAAAPSPTEGSYETVPMKLTKTEGTLLFSDCPEYAGHYGILYEGTVAPGKGRIYYYHVNETGAPAKIVVYAKGADKKQDMVLVKAIRGERSQDYISTGATLSFREATEIRQKPRTMTLPQGEKTILYVDDAKPIAEEDLASGMVEVDVKDPTTFGAAIVPDGSLEDAASYLQTALPLPPDSHEMRGTFPRDIYLENEEPWDFSKGNGVISIGGTIPFQKGTDEVSHVTRENTGDYGITYHMTFHTTGSGRYKLYINPQGGVYMGTFQIGNDPRFLRFYRTDGTLGKRWMGYRSENEYVEAGTWDIGKDLYFRFIPAGAAYLPVRLLFVKQ